MLKQASLFPQESQSINPKQIINVAQVKQLSPFRYPGGKTWLAPHVKTWLGNLKIKPALFVEPFAGGGIISLTVAYEDLSDQIIMVEIDEDVSSVWRTIFEGDAEWLVERIMAFNMTFENVQNCLNTCPNALKERAFQTILRNRISHGGILAQGAGVMKNGENGKGLASRWYPATLKSRIEQITKLKGRIKFIQGDGLEIINQYANETNAVFFIDPPYTAGKKSAGRRLYTHFDLDHPELFTLASTIQGDFLMTYENADEVKTLASEHGFEYAPISMQNRHNAVQKELLVSRALSWLEYR